MTSNQDSIRDENEVEVKARKALVERVKKFKKILN